MDINNIHSELTLLHQDLMYLKLYAERSLSEEQQLSSDFYKVLEAAQSRLLDIGQALEE